MVIWKDMEGNYHGLFDVIKFIRVIEEDWRNSASISCFYGWIHIREFQNTKQSTNDSSAKLGTCASNLINSFESNYITAGRGFALLLFSKHSSTSIDCKTHADTWQLLISVKVLPRPQDCSCHNNARPLQADCVSYTSITPEECAGHSVLNLYMFYMFESSNTRRKVRVKTKKKKSNEAIYFV
jgi:hypothetical protein